MVILNGDKMSPGLIRDIPIGSYPLVVKGDGWFYQGEIVIKPDETIRKVIRLTSVGDLELKLAAGCRASLLRYKKTSEITGESIKNLETGKYLLLIENDD